jgi:hypothetical protein
VFQRSPLTIAAFVVGLAGFAATASAQTVTCSPKDFRPSLVRIERQPPRAPGSGVVLVRRDRYAIVLTAKHVVEGEQDFSVYFQVAPDRRIPVRWTDETMFGFPPDGDLVVFRVDGAIPAAVIPEDPSTREPRDGARFVSWGYPAARRDGTLCSHEGTLITTAGGQLIVDGYVEAGVSGGPTFFIDPEDGSPKLAGIVVRGDGELRKGTTHAIDIRQAITIVSTSRDPANGNKPHVWPNIELP